MARLVLHDVDVVVLDDGAGRRRGVVWVKAKDGPAFGMRGKRIERREDLPPEYRRHGR